MARKLSSVARSVIWTSAAAAVSIAGLRAWAEGEVRVSSPATDVANPFAAKRQAASPAAPAPPVAVPPEETGVPKTYQNPFAKRATSPRFVTPQLQPGPMSRWHRPDQPHSAAVPRRPIHAVNDEAQAAGENWDLMGPLAVEQDRATVFALPAGEQANVAQPPAPPDPTYFGTENLHQPTWLTPHEAHPAAPLDEVAGANERMRAVAQAPADPFEVAEAADVVVCDDAPAMEAPPPAAGVLNAPEQPSNATAGRAIPQVVRPVSPPRSKDAEEWYAEAEQAAAEAASTAELAAVVHHCRRGLECRPDGKLAAALRSLAAWSCNRSGELESDQRREDEALKAFELAIQWDPNCWLALHNRAVSRAQQGDLTGALNDFNRSLQLNPGLAVAYRNRGELLAASGRTEEALADYTNALTQLPDDGELHAMRGHALHRLGRYEEAIADLSQSIEIAPHNATVYANRGNVYAEVGEYGRAVADFRQALALDAESADAHRSLAWLLATCPDGKYRDPQQALAAAEQAAQLAAPGDPFVLDTLAAAHANAGEFDRAVRYQEEAISNVPGNFADPFTARLALYRQQRPFRNGANVDGEVRAASLEAAPHSQR